ncbi:MAG: glycosyltransferase family 2 protein [Candidatus Krumholzibacteriota bacterium]|nr:glycosyltransferase family 2 protein [Candidatus Krumholzibacteriota bacterium]
MKPSIYLIVPTFNEARVLEHGLEEVIGRGYEVVVVDDGSTDDTGEILERLGVHALRHPVNLGQGAALQTGMTYALLRGADVVVHFDADGQHRSEDIATLLEPIFSGEVDVVLGSRFLRSSDAREVPPGRRVVLRCARVINGLLTGVWLSDAHNGFRALNRHAAESIYLLENRMAHASEILLQIRRSHLRYVERPTTIAYTEYSQEKGQSAWNGVRIVIDLVLRRIFR